MRYLVMVEEWDPYAGEGGERVWKQHADLVFENEDRAEIHLHAIEQGLIAAGKYYVIGQVKPE